MRLVLAPALLAAGLAAASSLAQEPARPLFSDVRQLTFEGKRAGEGYYAADGRRMIFQSEREAGNPFYQMYVLDLGTGDAVRVSPGIGKTTCGWLHPTEEKAIFASTQLDPDAAAKMQAELDFRASGEERRYSWDYDPAYELIEHDLATGEDRNLTNAEGYDAEGAYSPDGSRIAFASNRAAYAGNLTAEERARLERDPSYFMDIYVMDADGSNVRQLTSAPGYDGGVFWSPDGSELIFRRFSEDGARAEVYVMAADGSDERKITDLGALSWAPFFHPSGDYIVFATNVHGFDNFELYLVDAAGEREPVRVTEREGFDGLPTFSPDGAALSWTSSATADKTSQIFLASWNDAEARRRLGLPPAGAPAMDATDAAIRAADLRRHVEALASEAMEGRLTGTPGERAATAYVADAFRALGLEPAGDDGSWFQELEFTSGVSLGDGNALSVSVDGASLPAALDEDWRPLAFTATGKAPTAGATFAGYGLQAAASGSQPEYDSYAHLDVAGQWVLVWRDAPDATDAERRAHLRRVADLRYKASVAYAKGAAGLIVAPAPGVDYEDELPRLTYESGGGASGLPVIAIDRALADALLARAGGGFADVTERLRSGEMAGGRKLDGVEVGAELDLVFERKTGRNVLARLDLAPDDVPFVVIGAHVDHLGRGETSGSLARKDEAGEIHFGADDNASGVASLIEIAQSLTADRAAGRLEGARDVVFAAWSGEELGLLGSAHFVEALEKARGRNNLEGVVSAYLNMDMVGRLEDALTLQGIGSSGAWAGEIERRNAVIGLPVTTSRETYLPTDATSFYLARVPILAAFTGAHTEYHTPRDAPDTLNYEGMEKIARLMDLILRSQARTNAPPAYVEVERPSGQGAVRSANVFLGTIPDYASEGVTGVPISGVVAGGPADKAGLQGGDVIVGLAGAELVNIYDYMQAMNGLEVGKAVDIAVERGGERLELEITPATRE